MTSFDKFRKAVSHNLTNMGNHGTIFSVDLEKDQLWETYLASFPEGTNPIYKERTEHDCNCCKQFIRAVGSAVSIVDNELVSVWDIDVGGTYQVVADALSSLSKSAEISCTLYHDSSTVGTKRSNVMDEDTNKVITFDHFHHASLAPSCVVQRRDMATKRGEVRNNHAVLERSITEITSSAVEVVLDLITQNSLYRGEEHKRTVVTLARLKREYKEAKNGSLYIWEQSVKLGRAGGIRNTVIGTLLTDLSNDVPLETAVGKFEAKVAPHNYKRPKALITKTMVANAQKTVAELGIEDALTRRYAVSSDVSINNVLFADRTFKKEKGIFDGLATKASAPKLDKVQDVSVETFLNDILPKAESVEVMLDNKHTGNLMSLVSPIDKAAKSILKWGNNFSWAYKGDVTDSIKEKVKRAGGRVDGAMRVSLLWHNSDDLDIHVTEPNGFHIHHGWKHSDNTGGTLDVDMNVGANGNHVDPVENITWAQKSRIEEGDYEVVVRNYTKRGVKNPGFTVEIECNGETHTFHYAPVVTGSVKVATFNFSGDGITIKKSIPSSVSSKDVWGVNTNEFHKVRMVMNSPNHWDGEKTGNRHTFFILDGCKNPDRPRGFFNEFLRPDLTKHRKVFEVLGSKLLVPESEEQLSGVGFSSTQKNSVLCRVRGSFNRVVNVTF